jgi:hypothetical protein
MQSRVHKTGEFNHVDNTSSYRNALWLRSNYVCYEQIVYTLYILSYNTYNTHNTSAKVRVVYHTPVMEYGVRFFIISSWLGF